MLGIDRPSSLVSIVVKTILAEIAEGKLVAQSRLPTEQQLSERLEVSRSVVREAVSQLKADGVLTTRRGSGCYISANPAGSVFRLPDATDGKKRLEQLFEMRLWMETQAARAAAERRTKSDIKNMVGALSRMAERRVDSDGGQAAAAADVAFHHAIFAAGKNDYFVAFHDFLSAQMQRERQLAWSGGGSDEVREEHVELFDAIDRRDAARAAFAAERHLRNAARRLGVKL